MAAWSTTPVLGSLALSGCEAVVLHYDNNIVDYIVPGRDTSAIQRPGRLMDRIQIKGFFWSGSDTMKDTLLSYIGTSQTLIVPSTSPGFYFFNGSILFEKLSMFQDASKQYPYYEWMILNARMSGIAVVSGAFGAIVSIQPNVINSQVYATYLSPNVIQAQAYAGYNVISGVSGY